MDLQWLAVIDGSPLNTTLPKQVASQFWGSSKSNFIECWAAQAVQTRWTTPPLTATWCSCQISWISIRSQKWRTMALASGRPPIVPADSSWRNLGTCQPSGDLVEDHVMFARSNFYGQGQPQSNARQSNWHKHTWHDRPFIASLPSSSWDWRRSSLAWLVSCHWPSNIFQAIFARIVPSICRGQIEFRVGSLSNFVNLCIWIFWMNTENTVELRTRRTRLQSKCSNSPGSAQLTDWPKSPSTRAKRLFLHLDNGKTWEV